MLNLKKQRYKTDPSYYEPSILKTWIFEKFFQTNIDIGSNEIIVTIPLYLNHVQVGLRTLTIFILT